MFENRPKGRIWIFQLWHFQHRVRTAMLFFLLDPLTFLDWLSAIDFAAAVGNEIAIPFKCKNVELTLSKEEEELFEVIKKSWVLKIILESDEESAWGDD